MSDLLPDLMQGWLALPSAVELRERLHDTEACSTRPAPTALPRA